MAWTMPKDVTDRWLGPGKPADSDPTLGVLIADAEQLVFEAYPKIQDRIDDDRLSVDTVKRVVAQMVIRAMQNPDGVSSYQRTTGPFSESKSYRAGVRGLGLGADDLAALGPGLRGKAFSIDLDPSGGV